MTWSGLRLELNEGRWIFRDKENSLDSFGIIEQRNNEAWNRDSHSRRKEKFEDTWKASYLNR